MLRTRIRAAVSVAWLISWPACSSVQHDEPAAAPSEALPTTAADRGQMSSGAGRAAGMRGAAAAVGARAGSPAATSAGASGATAHDGGRAPVGGSSAHAGSFAGAAGAGNAGNMPAAGSSAKIAGSSALAGRDGAAAAGSAAIAGNGATGSAGSGPCAGPSPGSQGMNPLFSDVYSADPAALVDGCTFYIHCGHDEGPNSFVLREWYALWSTDMVHWERRVAMRLSDFAWADANAWAGQVVRKDGQYYWFAPVQERGGGMAIGVAVSDSPRGPFHDAIGKPLVNDAFEMSNAGFRQPSDTPFTIDPTVWIDDDGQAYLHYGGFSRMMAAKLSADLTQIDGKLQEVTPRGFFEAAYLIKHNHLYYEIYAAGTNPATIDYSTSDSPFGPWTYRGRILDALPSPPGEDAATNHAAVAQFSGQWYLVYHLSNGPHGGGTYKREVAVDKLTMRPDGTIDKVTPSAGLTF